MKNHVLPLVVVSLLGFSLRLNGQEEEKLGAPGIQVPATIDGAFGLTFGEKFTPDPSAKIDEGKFSQFTGGYSFKPSKPNPGFSKYVVFITPNSQRIYRIVAIRSVEKEEDARRFSGRVTEFLMAKYRTLEQGTRTISVDCSGPIDATVVVSYEDQRLRILAQDEQTKNDLEGFNGDGL